MSSDWMKGSLGDFIELKRGYDLPKTKREPGTVPLVSSSGESDTHSKAMVKGPGVVTGRYGTIGQVFYIKKDFWPLNTTLYVRDFKGNDPRFISYFLKTLNFDAYSDKGAVPGVNRNHLHEAEVLIPSLKLQKRIAKILEGLDDSIDTLQRQNTTLEAIAQRLFRSWFVNFDPVHAKAAGQEPEAMSAELAALFPSEFEESAIGLIPKGWTVTTFGDCLTHTIGGDWGKDIADEKYTKAVRVIRGTDIPDLLASKSGSVPARFVQPSKLNQRALHPFDLVIEVSGGSRDQSTGRSLMVTRSMISELGGAVVPTSFCRLFRPATQELGVILGCRLAWHYKVGNMWGYQVQSTGIANFQTTYFLSNDKMALPPEELQKKFKEIVAPMLESSYNPVIRALGQLRDHLLPRLISGKLSLSDAEATLASVKPAVERA